MKRNLRHLATLAAAGLAALLGVTTVPSMAASADRGHAPDDHSRARHVLLISVDGLHQFDLAQWTHEHPSSNLAALARRGTVYANASTSKPSDSFPGLLAEVTGGTPKSTGIFYDDSYSRALYAPGSNCTGAAGTEALYAENLDVGVSTSTRPVLGAAIDPTQLPSRLVRGKCTPVLPNDYLKTNSIFSVVHDARLRTAWSDKHPAYQIVNGRGTPNAVDDLFTPEINADLVPASVVDTRGTTITFPHPNPTGTGPYFIPDYVGNTEAYDQIKVDALLNEVDGRTSAGGPAPAVPAIFGMNFQTVSVAQKDVDPSKTCDPTRNDGTACDSTYVPGGYVPGTLAFTPQLEGGLQYIDGAVGAIVHELTVRHLYDSTEIILTAKHGQSPIDPAHLAKIGGADGTVLANAGIPVAQITHDDVSLIWLAHRSDTAAAVQALRDSIPNGNPARIATIYAGRRLARTFGDPTRNDRTPDIIVQPIAGTIYSTSNAKVAEHGGFAEDDGHVALVVAHGNGDENVVTAPVQTTQIGPTILRALGLDPRQLDAVRREGTQALPGTGN
jgi:hypothetical protein